MTLALAAGVLTAFGCMLIPARGSARTSARRLARILPTPSELRAPSVVPAASVHRAPPGAAPPAHRTPWRRLRIALARNDDRHAADDSVLACDLLAACLLAGSPVERALDVVGTSVGGSVGSSLTVGAAVIRLGAGLPEAADQIAGSSPVLGGLSRALRRSTSAGTPLAPALLRLAADARLEQRWRAEARARRVGTYAALPVALCFLPAFAVLGVVPLVVGLGSQLLDL